MEQLGIDIGGSGIKGAIVDTDTGKLVTERYRTETPDPSTPDAMAEVLTLIPKEFNWKGRIGCGFPAPIKEGKVLTANNIDKSWLGVKAHEVFEKACGHSVIVINDADAAGLAEMKFGAGRGVSGVVLLLTIGTGIGSALFVDGKLVPNSEFGQFELRGKKAERRASDQVRSKKDMSWKQWSKVLGEYITAVENLVWPDLIIIGGGVSKKADKFLPRIKARAEIVPAQLRNEAGIVGAALCAT
jgi:polyphosphate glucokinase